MKVDFQEEKAQKATLFTKTYYKKFFKNYAQHP